MPNDSNEDYNPDPTELLKTAEEDAENWQRIATDLFYALQLWPYPVPQNVTNALIAYRRYLEGRH